MRASNSRRLEQSQWYGSAPDARKCTPDGLKSECPFPLLEEASVETELSRQLENRPNYNPQFWREVHQISGDDRTQLHVFIEELDNGTIWEGQQLLRGTRLQMCQMSTVSHAV